MNSSAATSSLIEPNPYKEVMNNFFRSRAYFKLHFGEAPYKCLHPGCGQRFKVRSFLAHHRRKHLKEEREAGSLSFSTSILSNLAPQWVHATPEAARENHDSPSNIKEFTQLENFDSFRFEIEQQSQAQRGQQEIEQQSQAQRGQQETALEWHVSDIYESAGASEVLLDEPSLSGSKVSSFVSPDANVEDNDGYSFFSPLDLSYDHQSHLSPTDDFDLGDTLWGNNTEEDHEQKDINVIWAAILDNALGLTNF